MEISRAALLQVVKATRQMWKMKIAMNGFFDGCRTDTRIDTAFGDLADALYLFSGERLNANQSFYAHSKTMALISGHFSDEQVTDALIRMHEENFAWMPKPQTMEPDKMKELYQKNGGYETPEGDWT